jgi:hypothetical protein
MGGAFLFNGFFWYRKSLDEADDAGTSIDPHLSA